MTCCWWRTFSSEPGPEVPGPYPYSNTFLGGSRRERKGLTLNYLTYLLPLGTRVFNPRFSFLPRIALCPYPPETGRVSLLWSFLSLSSWAKGFCLLFRMGTDDQGGPHSVCELTNPSLRTFHRGPVVPSYSSVSMIHFADKWWNTVERRSGCQRNLGASFS
jgi:hypothetical protein